VGRVGLSGLSGCLVVSEVNAEEGVEDHLKCELLGDLVAESKLELVHCVRARRLLGNVDYCDALGLEESSWCFSRLFYFILGELC